MKHLGDITKIDGHTAPVVDVVIGGSPCQDLSVAGCRAGLAGERSGLFMEQIRIVKEMREEDRKRGRTGNAIRPRFMVWENVPGTFSSNHGEDFRAVLQEIIRIAEPDAPDVPLPPKGKWPLADAYYGDGWSIAYRVLDAQFWGVPQRRRRIHLVADFGGRSAPWIRFVHKSLRGDIDPLSPKGEAVSGGIGGSVGDAVTAFHLTQDLITGNGITPCLSSGSSHGQACIGVLSFKGGAGAKARGIGLQEEKAPTLTAAGSGTNQVPLIYSQQKIGEYRKAEVAATLTANAGTRKTNETIVQVMGVDCRNGTVRRLTPLECERLQGYPDAWTVIPAIEDMSDTEYEFWKAVMLEKAEREGKVRLSEDGIWEIWRFIPSENEDEEGRWENTHKPYKHKTKKKMVAWYNRSFCENTDSARYKALGNSIALPPWRWVLKRLSAMYEREATMASLFDGVGGFPLLWEQLNGKGSCLWASEIEEFPIAVTRYRFGGGD